MFKKYWDAATLLVGTGFGNFVLLLGEYFAPANGLLKGVSLEWSERPQ